MNCGREARIVLIMYVWIISHIAATVLAVELNSGGASGSVPGGVVFCLAFVTQNSARRLTHVDMQIAMTLIVIFWINLPRGIIEKPRTELRGAVFR